MTDKEKPMADWTPERLDALPEGTVIGATWRSGVESLLWHEEPGGSIWAEVGCGDDLETSGRVAQRAVSIRVVSVPIDALLSQNALEAATDAFAMTTNLVGTLGNEAERAVRAAITHVTGGTE